MRWGNCSPLAIDNAKTATGKFGMTAACSRKWQAAGQLNKDHLMDRLSIFLTLAVGAVVSGSLVILVLSLGWYSWAAIAGAAGLGFVLTWPASYAISRRIKRQDPNWDATKVDRVKSPIPDTRAPEV